MKLSLSSFKRRCVHCTYRCITTCVRCFAESLPSTRFRCDERTWRHRLTDFHQSWKPLIDGMVDAYLCWNYPDDPGISSDKTRRTTNDPISTPPSTPDSDSPPEAPGTTRNSTETNSPTPPASAAAEISVINIYTLSTSIKISCVGDQTTASALAGLGYIGNAPFHPSVAISIKTLELYRILRWRKPSFSVEAFVKVICDLYVVCIFFIIYPSCSHHKKDPISFQVSSFIFRCV